MKASRIVVGLTALFALASWPASGRAQSFSLDTSSGPSGAPGNDSETENLDFADIDGDGDRDVLFADGGNSGNDRNRVWVNQGGLQGGTVGVFVDETATRWPAVLDTSRDVDLADIDGDGDLDVYVANTSTIQNQASRWVVNLGGAQGGTEGFFADQTAARWVQLGVNDGTTTFSSIAPAQVLVSGGFITWSCDAGFADLDADGDLDLVHSSYGPVHNGNAPTRLFLNDGAGAFEEHNPSGVQLAGTSIPNGTPALWAEGVHAQDTMNATGVAADIANVPLGVELADLDGDFDVDLLMGDRNTQPRIFVNRLEETGALIHRDETFVRFGQLATGGGSYDQELGDLDSDGDLDLYGVNWSGFHDVVALADGAGNFGSFATLPGSQSDDDALEWLDYDNDGHLDVYVGNFSGQDRLYRNEGPSGGWSFTNVTATELPAWQRTAWGCNSCDVDDDGDYDVFVANVQENDYLRNVTGNPDLRAPSVAAETAPDRLPGGAPTVVRAQVLDGASVDVVAHHTVEVRYRLDGLPWTTAPAVWSGGQVFRAEIPGALDGAVSYEIRATDEHGNVGSSGVQGYVSSHGHAYCTAGTTTNGCAAEMSVQGTPSVAATGGFTVRATGVEGQRNGILFYGVNGPLAQPWGMGTSWLCVRAPAQRTGPQASGGTSGACDGALAIDFLARVAANPTWRGVPFSPGDEVWFQGWFRDPPAAKTTSLTGGVRFCMVP